MSQDRSHTVKTYSLAEFGLDHTPEQQAERAELEEFDRIAELRADRDSLRDALAALVGVVLDVFPRQQQGFTIHEWQALESARHVLGSKRA